MNCQGHGLLSRRSLSAPAAQSRKIHRRLLSIALTCFVAVTPARSQLGDLTALEVHPQGVSLYSGSDCIQIAVRTPQIAEMVCRFDGRALQDTLVAVGWDWPQFPVMIDTVGDRIALRTSAFLLEIDKKPIRFRVFDRAGKFLLRETPAQGWYENGLCLTLAPYMALYGLHNRRRGALNLAQGGEITAGAQGEAGAPFIWTPSGWGIVVNTDGGDFAIQGDQLEFLRAAGADSAAIQVFFLFGPPRQIFASLADVCGKAPLFPRFALGLINTEWGCDEQELLRDVELYRNREIPLDAYALDFDWMDWGSDNYGEFRWGAKFPGGPSGALKSHLDSLGVRLIGIRKPRIHIATQQGQHCLDNGYFLDLTTDYFSGKAVGRLNFHLPAVRNWFWDSFYRIGDAFRTGIIGYWNDEADEYGGNLMFMQMQRANFAGQRRVSDQRVWSVNRNFYLGAQRYAYGLWSGDIPTGFSSMAEQRLFMLSSVMLGAAWWGMDIGGFQGTPTPENYYRWMQFGAFVPIFRVHGTFNQEREPWNFGPEAERLAVAAIRLRYQLLPYLYSAAWQHHRNGLPPVRPLIIDYPDDPLAVNLTREWLFGDDLLVCPVVESGSNKISVYLPRDSWVDYFSGEKYSGPAYVNLTVFPETVPLFVRAGAVIPQAPVGLWSDDPRGQNRLDIVCFPGGADTTCLYEDDGLSCAYEQGVFATTLLVHAQNEAKAWLEIHPQTHLYSPPPRTIRALFPYLEARPDSVFFDGKAIPAADSGAVSWEFDQQKRCVQVHCVDDGKFHRVEFYLKPDLTPPTIDSLECRSSTRLWLRFAEPVLLGPDPCSAENTANYALSGGVAVESVRADPSQPAVILDTSPQDWNQLYTLTVSGIADRSRNRNQMPPSERQYRCHYTSVRQIELRDGQQGYQGTRDSHIAEFFPNNNMGRNSGLEACRFDGSNQLDDKAILLKFDLNGVFSPGDSLIRAELILTLSQTRNGTAVKSLGTYRVLKAWEEGTRQGGIDGLYAAQGQVTWLSAKHDLEPWNTPGGDCDAAASDVCFVGDVSQPYRWDVTSIVHCWMAEPDSNFGFLLKEEQPATTNGSKVFHSREAATVSLRPLCLVQIAESMPSRVVAETAAPRQFHLFANYPNPFNGITTLRFDLPTSAPVTLQVYNVRGELVDTLVDGHLPAGRQKIAWKPRDAASGIYFFCLRQQDCVQIRRGLYLK
ncbi:MAG TPA: glycoside hydrolase family 31 protein [bacterium]|nr:glycoside hydrolase family 31 protein [bacterium]